jgi:hypothetical protein
MSHRLARQSWPQYREEHLVLFSAAGLRQALSDAGLTIGSAITTTKFTTGAYLLGQVAAYSSPRGQRIAERSRGILRLPAMHRPLPLRFGEMTVVSQRASRAA